MTSIVRVDFNKMLVRRIVAYGRYQEIKSIEAEASHRNRVNTW